jgi:hypothetical protein
MQVFILNNLATIRRTNAVYTGVGVASLNTKDLGDLVAPARQKRRQDAGATRESRYNYLSNTIH